MKTLKRYSLILAIWGIISWPVGVQAQSGPHCLETTSADAPIEILEAIELAPAIVEVRGDSQSSGAVGQFYYNKVNVSFEGGFGHKALLVDAPDGCGPGPRTDDFAELRANGRVWHHDFRGPGFAAVQEISGAVDVTFLFNPGEQELEILLVDLMGPAYSSRGYWLLLVHDPTPATPTPVTPTATWTPTPTAVPPSPMPAPVLSLTSTSVQTVTLVTPPEDGISESAPTWPVYLMVSLAGLLLCCLAGWWAWHSQTGLPPIVTEIYERGQYRRTVTLNQFKKRAITIGSGKTDIQLDDETVPPLAARIIGQRGINGERQAVLEILDPDNPKIVVERQVLTDGDVYLVGNYEFVFTQYEAEESFFEGVETHV